jgi:hypothetical protein
MKSKLLLVFFIALCFQSLSQNLIHFGIINTVSNHELTVSQEVKRYNNDTLIYSIIIEGDTSHLTYHQLSVTLCSQWYPYQCIDYTFTFNRCAETFFINTQEMYYELQVRSELIINSTHKKTLINYNSIVPFLIIKPTKLPTINRSYNGGRPISLDFFYPPYTR